MSKNTNPPEVVIINLREPTEDFIFWKIMPINPYLFDHNNKEVLIGYSHTVSESNVFTLQLLDATNVNIIWTNGFPDGNDSYYLYGGSITTSGYFIGTYSDAAYLNKKGEVVSMISYSELD